MRESQVTDGYRSGRGQRPENDETKLHCVTNPKITFETFLGDHLTRRYTTGILGGATVQRTF